MPIPNHNHPNNNKQMTQETIRLSRIAKELNIGRETLVESLKLHGYEVDPSPNTKITPEQYAILLKEHGAQLHAPEIIGPEHLPSVLEVAEGTEKLAFNANKENGELYKVGDSVRVRINKIQENGCYCTFLPIWKNQFGFMPNYLMPSCFDENGNFTKSVGDTFFVVVNRITERGIILSDIDTYKKELEKIRKREEKARMQQLIDDFATKYAVGTIFEAIVVRVNYTRVYIDLGGVQGIIKKEDINWNEIDRLEDILFEGETINAVFLKYEKSKLYFSLKLLNEKPYDDSLYNLSLTDLLLFAGHNSKCFVGQAKRYPYGLFIENLYSDDINQKGKLLIDPLYGYNIRALVPNTITTVEENRFYRIKLTLVSKDYRLSRNQLFQFIATDFEEVSNPYIEDVRLAFQRNTTNPAANQRDAKLLDEIGKNMYSSKDRMFFELIQNADDAASQKGVLVNVATEGDYLILRHNGFSFDKDDFVSITTAANGTKKANENKTGYKGIGFKSVFTDSEQVFIHTGGYHFKFDKREPIFQDFNSFYLDNNPMIINDESKSRFLNLYSDYKKQFDGIHSIPWQLEPIWVESFPEQLGDNFTTANVSIALKLGENKIEGDSGYSSAIEDIIRNPKFMLFLRNTKRIDFNGKSVSKTTKGGIITLKNSFNAKRIEYFRRDDFVIEVNNDVFENNDIELRIKVEKKDEVTGRIIEARFVDLHNQEIENVPQKIAINNSTSISFAAPITENGELNPNTKCNEISMFAFLPTLVKDFRFPFYINANFILDPPRQRILGDNPWNFYLMQEIAKCIVRWCGTLNENREEKALNILVNQYFEEDSPDTRQLAEHFNRSYKHTLETEAFILNHKGTLSRQDEIILDIPGISQLIGADLFCKIMGTSKCLPSTDIDAKILRSGIFERIEKPTIDDVIAAITNNADFNSWFITATGEQKDTIFRWIEWVKAKNYSSNENDLPNLVSNLPLFQFGEQFKTRREIDLNDYVICTEHIKPIKDVLLKIGIQCSDNYFDESCTIYDFIEPQNEEKVFESIAARIMEQNEALLEPSDKLRLFLAMEGFLGVGPEKLSKIRFFHNSEGHLSSLNEMFAYNEYAPLWARPFMIAKEECFDEIIDLLQNEFDVIWKNIDTITTEQGNAITDVYHSYKWTDDKYTIALIDKHKKDNNLALLLPIVEDAHSETKQYFLDGIQKIELLSGATYKKESYEYRVLQMALSIMADPSIFSSKVYFDGICIKDYSVKDEVECTFIQEGKEKKVIMSLARLLPKYQNQSNTSDSIKIIFNGEKWIDKFFDAKPKPISEVYSELNSALGIVLETYSPWKTGSGNAIQYMFSVYKRKQSWSVVKGLQINLRSESDSFIFEMMDFLFDNDLQIETSPFTYHLRSYFKGKSFDSRLVFEEETLLKTIELWANDDKKKKYLIRNGVKNEEDPAILFRKLFIENKQIDFLNSISDSDLASGVAFIASAGYIDRPFEGANQRAVLLELINKKCCILETKVDLEELQKGSTEWDNADYNTWTQEHYPRIFIYPGYLPESVYYGSVLLVNYNNDKRSYYYDKQRDPKNEKLYISDTKKIDDILFEIAKEGKTSFFLDDYKALFLEGKVAVSKDEIVAKDKAIESLSESNRKKDEIIKLYRDKFGVLEDTIGLDYEKIGESDVAINTISEIHHNAQDEINLQMGKVIERDGIPDAKKIAAHKEAGQIIREKLEHEGYDCSNWIDHDDDSEAKKWHSANQVDGIISPDGNSINLVYKSAIGGYIYLSATDFEFLTSNSNNVLMVWDGKNVHSVSAEDIFNKNSNVNLIFDTEYTPKHYYAALSKVFQYVKRTTFAVKNPVYNAYETIKTFGMDSKTEGVQELFDDNDL